MTIFPARMSATMSWTEEMATGWVERVGAVIEQLSQILGEIRGRISAARAGWRLSPL
jgi:hypothetical protein